MNTRQQARLCERISDAIKPMFVGHPPQVQGAILADLMATWLAGHRGPKDERDQLREDLLQRHCDTVRELVAYYDAQIEAEANGGVA